MVAERQLEGGEGQQEEQKLLRVRQEQLGGQGLEGQRDEGYQPWQHIQPEEVVVPQQRANVVEIRWRACDVPSRR